MAAEQETVPDRNPPNLLNTVTVRFSNCCCISISITIKYDLNVLHGRKPATIKFPAVITY
jgi:hypothetical protein